MLISKPIFPIASFGAMLAFYISDSTSISASGFTISILLTLIGIAIVERLDKLIKQNEEIVESLNVGTR